MKALHWLRGLSRYLQGIKPGFGQCPWCGYQHDCEGLDLEVLRSGTSFDGEYTSRWLEAIATCPACGHKFQYDDGG